MPVLPPNGVGVSRRSPSRFPASRAGALGLSFSPITPRSIHLPAIEVYRHRGIASMRGLRAEVLGLSGAMGRRFESGRRIARGGVAQFGRAMAYPRRTNLPAAKDTFRFAGRRNRVIACQAEGRGFESRRTQVRSSEVEHLPCPSLARDFWRNDEWADRSDHTDRLDRTDLKQRRRTGMTNIRKQERSREMSLPRLRACVSDPAAVTAFEGPA